MYGIKIETNKKRALDCSHKGSLSFLTYGLFLENKTDFRTYANCLSVKEKNSSSLVWRNKELYFPFTKIKRKIITQSNKEFLSTINLLTSSDEKQARSPQVAQATLNILKKRKSILASLSLAILYFKVGNRHKAELYLSGILSKPALYHQIETDLYHLSLNEQEEYAGKLRGKIEKLNRNEKLSKALKFYFDRTRELRAEDYKSYQYGSKLPFVWAFAIQEQSSSSEYTKYLNSIQNLKEKISQDSLMLLLFKKHEVKDSELKKVIIKKVIQIHKSRSVIDQLVFYELMNSESFYQFVLSNTQIKVGLIQNGKRKFFRSLLKNPNLNEFALFKLIQMGDFSLDNLRNFLAGNGRI